MCVCERDEQEGLLVSFGLGLSHKCHKVGLDKCCLQLTRLAMTSATNSATIIRVNLVIGIVQVQFALGAHNARATTGGAFKALLLYANECVVCARVAGAALCKHLPVSVDWPLEAADDWLPAC